MATHDANRRSYEARARARRATLADTRRRFADVRERQTNNRRLAAAAAALALRVVRTHARLGRLCDGRRLAATGVIGIAERLDDQRAVSKRWRPKNRSMFVDKRCA